MSSWAGTARASSTLTFFPSQDAYITGQRTTRNYGTCMFLRTDKEASQPDRALLQFDLSALAGQTILSATLQLVKTAGANNSNVVEAHRVTAAWDEGTQCDLDGDVSWDERQSGVAWTTAGGDFAATVEDSTTVSINAVYSWNLTSLTQAWVAGTVSNFGVLLKVGTESGGNQFQEYGSDEATQANRPQLVVVIDAPTEAVVSSPTATSEDGQVVVRWETASEVGTAGFYLFRYNWRGGKWMQVNDKLLAGLLPAPQGGTYRIVDGGASLDETLTYALLEVEGSGRTRVHGPYDVPISPLMEKDSGEEVSGGFARRARRQSPQLVERAVKGRARRAVRDSELRAAPTTLGRSRRNGSALKILVPAEGVYFIGVSPIATALSLSESEASFLLSRGGLSLSNRDRNVAWLAAGNGSGLYFYGKRLETLYTNDNVYWLKVGSGRRVGAVDGTPRADGPGFHLRAEHLEKDAFAATVASKDPDSDFWYWSALMASDPANSAGTYSFAANAIDASGPRVTLGVNVYGATSTKHRLQLRVNGTTVGEGAFQDVGATTVRVELDATLLVEGANTISVQSVLEPGVAFDVVYVDSLDVVYPRRHQAVSDALSFRAEGAGAVRVDGFSLDDATILDVTHSVTPMLVTGATRDAGSVRFEARGGRRYFVVSSAARRTAEMEPVSSLETLRAGGADHVVIAPASLAEAAGELSRYRESRGLRSRVVTLEAIHDEFGFGIPAPQNVQRFLRNALDKWRPAPRFVVLIGKGTYDFKDVYGIGDNLMTPLMAATPDGLFASDNRLADVKGGDGVPDVMIGRIPVLSDDELSAYVGKIAAFEGVGLGESLFLADNPDVAGDFTAASNEMVALLPEDVAAHRVHLGETPIAAARQALLDRLTAGVGYWNYIGHGGLDRFASEGLMLTTDVPLLANATTPILASLTCNVGRFEIPGWSSLAEALVMKEHGGAIVAWSPSGLSYDSQALILNRALIEALYDENTQYLGEAIASARDLYSREGKLPFMLLIYNLLGDPATRIR